MIALDKTRPKVTKLTENVKRFNLACVHSFAFDATRALGPTELHRPPTASGKLPAYSHFHRLSANVCGKHVKEAYYRGHSMV